MSMVSMYYIYVFPLQTISREYILNVNGILLLQQQMVTYGVVISDHFFPLFTVVCFVGNIYFRKKQLERKGRSTNDRRNIRLKVKPLINYIIVEQSTLKQMNSTYQYFDIITKLII